MPKGTKKRAGPRIDKITGRFGSSYKPSFVKLAKLLGEAGKTDAEAAEFFGVTRRTITNWKLNYPEFREALQIGKDVADARVEQSLYNMALGYFVDHEEIFVIEGKIVRVQTRKYIKASEVAALAWLNNRRSGEWQRNPEPAAPPPAPPEQIDITPANARAIARRFALTLVKGDKSA